MLSPNEEGYVELKTIYNKIFALSQNYIDNNKQYILNREDKDLNDASKSAVKTLSKQLNAYKKELERFLLKRRDVINFFDKNSEEFNDKTVNADKVYVFKKDFGALVESNIKLSTALANAVEATQIFERVNSGTPTSIDSKVVKEFVGIRLLPVFSNFKITEMENRGVNLKNEQQNGENKEQIIELVDILDKDFIDYQEYFDQTGEVQKITLEEMNKLWERINTFLEETDSFFESLKSFNIFKFSEADYIMENYKKTNSKAEIYLEKMEQYLNITFPSFIKDLENVLVGVVNG